MQKQLCDSDLFNKIDAIAHSLNYEMLAQGQEDVTGLVLCQLQSSSSVSSIKPYWPNKTGRNESTYYSKVWPALDDDFASFRFCILSLLILFGCVLVLLGELAC